MAAGQGTYRLRCAFCGREWHDSIVGKCPEREIHVCMYCCRRLCDKSYTLPGQIGQRCRAWDAARKGSAGAKKTVSLPQSPAATAPSRREPGTGEAPAAAGKDKTKPEPSESGSGLERTTGRNLRAATGESRDAFRPRRTI